MKNKNLQELKKAAKQVNKEWVKTGIGNKNKKYFGVFNKKVFSVILLIILVGVINLNIQILIN